MELEDQVPSDSNRRKTSLLGDVFIGETQVAMPKIFLKSSEKIRNFEVRPDDLWLVTFPKCGKLFM